MKKLHAFHVEKKQERNDFQGGNYVAFVEVEGVKMTYVGVYNMRKNPHSPHYFFFDGKARTVGGYHDAGIHDESRGFVYAKDTELSQAFEERFLGEDPVETGVIVDAEALCEFMVEAGDIYLDEYDNPDRDPSNLQSTTEPVEPKPRQMQFNVQMLGHTYDDMESLIIQSASELVVKRSGGEIQLGQKAFEMAMDEIRGSLERWSGNILNITAVKEGDKAYTVGDMILHKAQEFITQQVDMSTGEAKSGFVSRHERVGPRIQYLISKSLQQIFEKEVEQANRQIIAEMKAAYREKINAMVDAQKAKFEEALDKMSK